MSHFLSKPPSGKNLLGAVVLALVLGVVRTIAADGPPLPPATPVPDQQTLEQRFEKLLTGAVLAGSFTEIGRDPAKPLTEEKYTIEKVRKLSGDFWLFTSRIEYGNHDVTLSMPIEVRFAGDTPMLLLTDYPVPGFGTFTCRILIYKDRYAGTWAGANHGGHMFGRVLSGAAAKAND